jgi:Mn-dependent DtxR family transcriptional regulator
MSFDSKVLRAMLRLARRREAAEDSDVAVRVGATESQVRASMRRLRAAGWVDMRDGRAGRLTLEGLAIAVALLPARPAAGRRRAPRASRAA